MVPGQILKTIWKRPSNPLTHQETPLKKSKLCKWGTTQSKITMRSTTNKTYSKKKKKRGKKRKNMLPTTACYMLSSHSYTSLFHSLSSIVCCCLILSLYYLKNVVINEKKTYQSPRTHHWTCFGPCFHHPNCHVVHWVMTPINSCHLSRCHECGCHGWLCWLHCPSQLC